jgi:murein L,D-transpeptidase YcbB/YkuD
MLLRRLLIALLFCASLARAQTPVAESPAWSTAATKQLLEAIRASAEDGLDPRDYRLAELEAGAGDPGAASATLRHAVLLELAADLRYGRLHAQGPLPGVELPPLALTAPEKQALDGAIAGATITQQLESLRPTQSIYRALRQSLAAHRAIAANGGWGTVPDGAAMKPGERSTRVAALRKRLRASNDLRSLTPAADDELFDADLQAAVSHFQVRHQLDGDGVVGARTLQELSVPVEARIDQVRVNLERARRLLHDVPPTFVLADLAGYNVRYFENGVEKLRSRAVIGKSYRKTPIFRDEISYVDFNPFWTVPPGILRNDVLPKLRKDPGYLASEHMRLIGNDHAEIDPATVDWNLYTGRRVPPFQVRQDPGPHNSLGRVKLMFPNSHNVYLHDTPHHELYGETRRAFSSGCVRVEDVIKLAELLLAAQGWTTQDTANALATGKLQRVRLARPVPVFLYYWTASIEDDGDVLFKHDVYGRDAAILKALADSSSQP